jgi:hypothetical protein
MSMNKQKGWFVCGYRMEWSKDQATWVGKRQWVDGMGCVFLEYYARLFDGFPATLDIHYSIPF